MQKFMKLPHTFHVRRALAIALATAGISYSAHAAVLFTDHFNYPDGTNLGAVTGPWNTTTAGGGDSSSQILVTAASAQTSPTSFATATNNGVAVVPTGSTKKTFANFNGSTGVPNVDGNVAYASFLLNVRALPNTTQPVAFMNDVSANSAWGIGVYVSSTGQIGVAKRSGAVTNVVGTPVATQGTHLVVMRYTFQAGSDEVAIWVDPPSATYGAATAPDTTSANNGAATTAGSDFTHSMLIVGVDAPATTGYSFWFDEVRVGTNWADVTPSDNQTHPASISQDPNDASAYVGQSAFFSVVANGDAPLSYQWYFNTNALQDATNSLLSLTNVQTTDAGPYFCIVTNSYGSATSAVAQLVVTVPVPPAIITQPQDQLNILPGAIATFSVSASGSDPLGYQWYFNTNTAIPGANSSILTINNVQATNAGTYSVAINNFAGSTNSAYAALTLNTNPVGPAFVSQPASVVVLAGSSVSFSAAASGTAPIFYQWLKNSSPIPSATSTTLTLTNVQNSDVAGYSLRASNSVGTAISSIAALTITVASTLPNSEFNLYGFGRNATGGGVIPDTDPAYAKVYTPLDLANAVISFNKTGAIRVIEIMNDLDLGWNEIGATVQNLSSSPFNSAATPQLHPRLITTGVSKMDIKYKNGGLTIFSANGATIRHCTFNIKSTHNIIVRNLKFDQMWEWDEATKGQYDKNDWDFIDLANGGNVWDVWIDHCTFTKSYDGIVDMKAGSTNVTLSWCKYTGDDGATNSNSFVWQQINSLESNKTSYTFYNFLRNNGFSTTNIVTIIQGHDKTHLMGSNDKDPNNVNLSATFHHGWFINCWDRAVPRLRAGNVHDYDNYMDDTLALAAKRLRDAVQRAMTPSASNSLKNTYSFNPPLNGSISTEGGAILVEKCVYNDCLTPLRNNQTDPSDPTYTGKILGLDMIYQMDSTTIRGNSTDPGSPLGPFQAPIIPFSWNTNSGAPGGQLPYTYIMDDPSQLQSVLSAGAGAGVVNWNKTNWLLTTYAPTAPNITAQPQNQSVAPSNNVTFTVVASGSANLFYQWYFNTNTILSGATNSALTLNNVLAMNAGTYSVIVSNSAGSVTSTGAVLTVSSGTHPQPQTSNLVFSNGVFSLTVSGDSGVDYIVQGSTNLVNWDNLYTNHSPTPPFNWSDSSASNFVQRFYRIQLGQ
jgi:pectate lyase